MRSLENCKEYRILAEHKDDSSFIKEYEHKKKQIFSPHTNRVSQHHTKEESLTGASSIGKTMV